jgi:Uma2 family endonuclease
MIARNTSLATRIPPLSNGDRMNFDEFCRRWDATPNIKHAELINGRVYMNPPVNWDHHRLPTARILGWLAHYEMETPGLELATDASVYLGPEDCVQPDAALRIQDKFGGSSQKQADGSLSGPPELIVEVAASSVAYDLHEKKDLYAANGVAEYLVWLVYDRRVVWFRLHTGVYEELPIERDGRIQSQVFPGLWLDSKSLLNDQKSKISAMLRRGLASQEYAAFVEQLKSQSRKRRKS